MPLKPLRRLLIEEGAISDEVFDGESSIRDIFARADLIFEKAAQLLEEYYGIESCELNEAGIESAAIGLLDYTTAMRYLVIPISIVEGKLVAAMADPFDPISLEDIRIMTGYRVKPLFARKKDIEYFIHKFYAPDQISTIASQFIVDEKLGRNNYSLDAQQRADIQNAPTVKLIDNLIESAILYHASDIHIEPFTDIVRTRYRIDGRLTTFQNVSISLLPNIISRLKIMSGMDISEKRQPQDGHFSLEAGTKIDFRTSIIPTIHGEKAVIRLIYNNGGEVDIHNLGFLPEDVASMLSLLLSPHGVILVTGPTGSGKTTTLAGFINQLNRADVNIVTIEDPVENVIPGVNQININPKAGLSFSNVLRSILRQDPDIIMIGEIRDTETAGLAIRAAITGHLALCTLHTNDAVSAVMRLLDMGVEHYLLAAAIKGIISQRLVRTICPYCKTRTEMTERDRLQLELGTDTVVYTGVGCSFCGYTGYRGRTVVYEYIRVDDAFRMLIDKKATYDEMKAALSDRGSMSIRDNAITKVLVGNTTVEEALRAVYMN